MTDETPPRGEPHVLEGEHAVLRRLEYPDITDQLDQLWHDIDAGSFGEAAKQGRWYNMVKAIRERNPKA